MQLNSTMVIYSPNESASNGGAGFWSNEAGWTELESATRFTVEESQTLNLPLSVGNDAKWVALSEAEKHY